MVFEDGLKTHTSEQQHDLEQKVREIYQIILDQDRAKQEAALRLRRPEHIKYLLGGLQRLPSGYVSLDASRPWLCYWIVHSLALLQAPLPSTVRVAGGFPLSCLSVSPGSRGPFPF